MKDTSTKLVTKQEAEKWRTVTDFLHYSSLAVLFMSLFIFEAIGKNTAKKVVIPWACAFFVYSTLGFIVGWVSANKTKKYFNQQFEKHNKAFDSLIKS